MDKIILAHKRATALKRININMSLSDVAALSEEEYHNLFEGFAEFNSPTINGEN